jgi:predicted RecA/RadA family phage recombinase
MGIYFVSGTPTMIDHTPGSAVDAGDIVMLGGIPCIAHLDIAANVKGALAFPSGSATYRGTLKSGAVIAPGDSVWGDVATNTVSHSEDEFMGYAIEAKTQSATVTEVEFVHCLQTNIES